MATTIRQYQTLRSLDGFYQDNVIALNDRDEADSSREMLTRCIAYGDEMRVKQPWRRNSKARDQVYIYMRANFPRTPVQRILLGITGVPRTGGRRLLVGNNFRWTVPRRIAHADPATGNVYGRKLKARQWPGGNNGAEHVECSFPVLADHKANAEVINRMLARACNYSSNLL